MDPVFEKILNVYEELQKMDGVLAKKPQGAFYIIAKLPLENAEKFVIWMLTEFDIDGETTMVAPAEGFYATEGLGKDEIRIAYILDNEKLKKAMYILKQGLIKYKEINE